MSESRRAGAASSACVPSSRAAAAAAAAAANAYCERAISPRTMREPAASSGGGPDETSTASQTNSCDGDCPRPRAGSTGPPSPRSSSSETTTVGIVINPTTGGELRLRMCPQDSIKSLRKLVSKELKIPKEKICLLFKNRHLREGTLEDNCLTDGCHLTLLPSIETGLTVQRPEQSVVQALESLNESQVDDFLSGHAPLNLTMRSGEHVMLIQLHLSTTAATNSERKRFKQQLIPAPSPSEESDGPPTTPPSMRALLEASRNLARALHLLSSEVFAEESQIPRPPPCRPARACTRRPPMPESGAIMERMRHHGKGVYSGTFSSTLNPALQDPSGAPKRDISTIIHILHDLLCAHAQCSPAPVLAAVVPAASPASPPSAATDSRSRENSDTRRKVEHLRLVMSERRARRNARRRQASQPYADLPKPGADLRSSGFELKTEPIPV